MDILHIAMSTPDSHVWKTPDAVADPAKLAPELHQVLESKAFKNTYTLRKLLLYLWEHRDDNISEYAIATEALGRQAAFDPKFDATVRVQISRLRQKLREFYENEDDSSSWRIVIPLGSHRLELADPSTQDQGPGLATYTADLNAESTTLQVTALENLTRPELAPATRRPWPLVPLLVAAVVLLLFSNSWLLWRLQSHRAHAETPSVPQIPPFWGQFLDNGFRTRVILPTPVFFDYGSVIVRDTYINDFSKLETSAPLVGMRDHLGKPSLAQFYISSSDVFGAMRIERFLDPTGNRFMISSTLDLPEGTIDQENIIVLGTDGTLAPFRRYLDQLSFHLDVHTQQVTDTHPSAGSPRLFRTIDEGPSHSITPGIIAVLPGAHSGTRIMIVMATVNTSALIAYLTSETGLAELERAKAAHQNSPYFEAVVLSELNGTVELKNRLAAFKPYNPAP